jgi:hypothetical protein
VVVMPVMVVVMRYKQTLVMRMMAMPMVATMMSAAGFRGRRDQAQSNNQRGNCEKAFHRFYPVTEDQKGLFNERHLSHSQPTCQLEIPSLFGKNRDFSYSN